MKELKIKYKTLKNQLSNLGEETSMCEVGWNDAVLESIGELFENVEPDIAKKIMLNHI